MKQQTGSCHLEVVKLQARGTAECNVAGALHELELVSQPCIEALLHPLWETCQTCFANNPDNDT